MKKLKDIGFLQIGMVLIDGKGLEGKIRYFTEKKKKLPIDIL